MSDQTTRREIVFRTLSVVKPYLDALPDIPVEDSLNAVNTIVDMIVQDTFPAILNTVTSEAPCTGCECEGCDFGRSLDVLVTILVGELYIAQHPEVTA